MADVDPRNVTHCRKCRCNRYGDNCRCLVCNSTEVHTFQVYVCLACNREYDSEDSAYECCPSEEDDEQGSRLSLRADQGRGLAGHPQGRNDEGGAGPGGEGE